MELKDSIFNLSLLIKRVSCEKRRSLVPFVGLNIHEDGLGIGLDGRGCLGSWAVDSLAQIIILNTISCPFSFLFFFSQLTSLINTLIKSYYTQLTQLSIFLII